MKLALKGRRSKATDFLLDAAFYLLENYVPPVPNQINLFPASSYLQHCLIVGAEINTMSSLYAGNVCYTGQYFSPGFPATAASPWVSGWDVQNPITPSNICTVVYERIAPATADPVIQPYVPPVPAKWFIDDEVQPEPRPLSWPLPGVRTKPSVGDPEPDPVSPSTPQPATRPGPGVSPFPSFPAGPTVRPVVPPVVAIDVTPGTSTGQPPVVTYPPVGPARPPEPGEKEKKGTTPRAIIVAVGAATEGLDALNALYEALPKSVKISAYKKLGRQPNPYEKAKLLYQHWDEVRLGAAVYNLAKNELQDRLIGGANRRPKNPHTGFNFRGGGVTQIGL